MILFNLFPSARRIADEIRYRDIERKMAAEEYEQKMAQQTQLTNACYPRLETNTVSDFLEKANVMAVYIPYMEGLRITRIDPVLENKKFVYCNISQLPLDVLFNPESDLGSVVKTGQYTFAEYREELLKSLNKHLNKIRQRLEGPDSYSKQDLECIYSDELQESAPVTKEI